MIYRIVVCSGDGSGIDIYGPDAEMAVLDPHLEIELNSAGSLEFTLPVDNINWNIPNVFQNEIEVWEDDKIIWFGRPLQIIRDWNNQRRVICEGALSYFNDTIQRTWEQQPENNKTNITFFKHLLSVHNNDTDNNKHFTEGEITIESVKAYRKTDYETTLDCLQNMCLSTDGGYFILRKEYNFDPSSQKDVATRYIDWYENLPENSMQDVQFGYNLLDITQDLNGADICTVVIATGKDDIMLNTLGNKNEDGVVHISGSDEIYYQPGVEVYGRVIQQKSWNDYSDVSALWRKAKDWLIDKNTDIPTIECSAADLYYISDPGMIVEGPLQVGMNVKVVSGPHDFNKTLMMYKISMDLDSGIKKVTLGTPPKKELTDIVAPSSGGNSTSGNGGKDSSSGGSSGSGGGGGSVNIPVKDVKVKSRSNEDFKSVVKNKTAKIDLTVIDVPVKGVTVDGKNVVDDNGIAVIDTSDLATLKLEDVFWRNTVNRNKSHLTKEKETETVITVAGYYCIVVTKSCSDSAWRTPPWSENYIWSKAYRNGTLLNPIFTKNLGVLGKQTQHVDVTPVSAVISFYNLKEGDIVKTYNELSYYYYPMDISQVTNPVQQGLYEYNDKTYFYELSEDTVPDTTKTYYMDKLNHDHDVDFNGVEWIFRIKNFDAISNNFMYKTSKIEGSVQEGSSWSVFRGVADNRITNTELFSKNDDNVYLIIKMAASSPDVSTMVDIEGVPYVPADSYYESTYKNLNSLYTNEENTQIIHIGGNTEYGALGDGEKLNNDGDIIYYENTTSEPHRYFSSSTVAYAEIVSGKDILNNTNKIGAARDTWALVIQLSADTEKFVTKEYLDDYIVPNATGSSEEDLNNIEIKGVNYRLNTNSVSHLDGISEPSASIGNDGDEYFKLSGLLPNMKVRSFKFKVTERKGSGNDMNQFSCLGFYDDTGSNKYSWPEGTTWYDDVGHFENEPLIDNGKMLLVETPGTVTVELPAGSYINTSVYNKFGWYTANDSTDRDPVGWELYVSEDYTNYFLVDSRSQQTITDDRNALAFKENYVSSQFPTIEDIYLKKSGTWIKGNFSSGGGSSSVEPNPSGAPMDRLVTLGVNGIVYEVSAGNTNERYNAFSYTGDIQTFEAPETGTYKLEVWGAQGGSGNSLVNGGYGGYSVGYVNLTQGDILYICVGGKGGGSATGDASVVGYNGGGEGNYGGNRGNGGGATHIALVNGTLNILSNNLSDILIVAGGGGGAGYYAGSDSGDGGSGGGYIGGHGLYAGSPAGDSNSHTGSGGTQSAGGETEDYSTQSAGSFGQGANRDDSSLWGGSGGGGGLYGGGASTNNAGAGGGSGYINTTELTNACMYGYNVSESSSASIKTISVSTASSDPTPQVAKEGNGYAKISWGGGEFDPYVTVNDLYNACVANNITPASKSLVDIVAALLGN